MKNTTFGEKCLNIRPPAAEAREKTASGREWHSTTRELTCIQSNLSQGTILVTYIDTKYGIQAILDENEYYEATEGILYGAGIAD